MSSLWKTIILFLIPIWELIFCPDFVASVKDSNYPYGKATIIMMDFIYMCMGQNIHPDSFLLFWNED